MDWIDVLTGVVTALAISLGVIAAGRVGCRLAERRWPRVRHLERRSRIPFRVLVLMIALNPVVASVRPADAPHLVVDVGRDRRQILAIVAGGWFLTSVVLFLEDSGSAGYASTSATTASPGGCAPRSWSCAG